MDKEIWKTVTGFSKYEISNYGNIRSIERQVITSGGIINNYKLKNLKWYKDAYVVKKDKTRSAGYLIRRMMNDQGKYINVYCHRLVAIEFIPNENTEQNQVNHKDENTFNNHYSNLEWVSQVDNLNYGTRNERVALGQIGNKNRAKHYREDILAKEFKEKYNIKFSINSVVALFNNEIPEDLFWLCNEYNTKSIKPYITIQKELNINFSCIKNCFEQGIIKPQDIRKYYKDIFSNTPFKRLYLLLSDSVRKEVDSLGIKSVSKFNEYMSKNKFKTLTFY